MITLLHHSISSNSIPTAGSVLKGVIFFHRFFSDSSGTQHSLPDDAVGFEWFLYFSRRFKKAQSIYGDSNLINKAHAKEWKREREREREKEEARQCYTTGWRESLIVGTPMTFQIGLRSSQVYCNHAFQAKKNMI